MRDWAGYRETGSVYVTADDVTPSLDAVEAAVLSPRVGQTFSAVVVDRDDRGLELQLLDVPVVARAKGKAELGATVEARLESADVATGQVRFVVD